MKSFKLLILTVFGFLGSVGLANAAVDAAVTTALTDAATDAATVGGAVLVVLVAVAAFRYIRRAL